MIRKKSLIKIFLALLVSGGLLTLFLQKLDPQEALERLQGTKPLWLLAAFIASLGVLWARGVRFWLLSHESSLGSVTASIAVQNFLTRITPLRLGELALPLLLHRTEGEPPASCILSLLLVRLTEIWVLLLFAGFGALSWFGQGEDLGGLGAAALIASLLLLSFRWCFQQGLKLLEFLVARLGLNSITFLERLIRQLKEAAAEPLNFKQQLALLLGSVAVMSAQFLLYGFVLMSLDLQLHPAQILIGVTGSAIAGAIPVLSVGSVGTHEAGWTTAFLWVGLSWNDAVLSGLLGQLLTLLFAALFSLPAWLYLRPRLDSNKGQAEDLG